VQIKDGDIFAAINQKDGMVSFQEDPEQYNTCEMTQRLNNEIHQYVPLSLVLYSRVVLFLFGSCF
jgi:COP9 signalosome complex subunit 3